MMPNGRYFDRFDSLKFPLYEIPPVRVIYRGFVDEIDNNLDLIEGYPLEAGRFADLMVAPEPTVRIPSYFECLGGESDEW